MATPGDLCWIDDGTKVRPAVVLKVLDEERLLVVFGTSTDRQEPRVSFHHLSIAGKVLGLSNPTFLYARAAIAKRTAIRRVCGRCPFRTFFDIERLIGQISP